MVSLKIILYIILSYKQNCWYIRLSFFGTSHINRILKLLCSIVLKNSKKVTIPIMVPYRRLRIEMRLEFKLPRASIFLATISWIIPRRRQYVQMSALVHDCSHAQSTGCGRRFNLNKKMHIDYLSSKINYIYMNHLISNRVEQHSHNLFKVFLLWQLLLFKPLKVY